MVQSPLYTRLSRYGLVGVSYLINTACSPREIPRVAPDQPQTSLHQVVFKRSDLNGQLLWKLEAESIIKLDQNVAHLSQVRGTFYHNNKAVYHLQAPQGQVHQQSTRIHLQGPIVMQDARNHSTLQSQDIRWHSRTGQLMAQSGVVFKHPRFSIRSQHFQASTRTNHARMSGQVTLHFLDQGLQVQADQMTWLPHQNTIQATSTAPAVVRLSPTLNNPKPMSWQQAQAQQMDLNLQSRQLTLRRTVKMILPQPPIQLYSPKVVVDLATQRWYSSQGIRLQHQGITATANEGWFDPSPKLQLKNQVSVQGLPHQAQLQAQTLTWDVLTHGIQAQGSLVYQQAAPWIRITGTRAVGNLRDQTLEVSEGKVITDVLP